MVDYADVKTIISPGERLRSGDEELGGVVFVGLSGYNRVDLQGCSD